MERESQFHAAWQSLGAKFIPHAGWRVAESFGDVAAEYRALRQTVGILDRCYRAHILATGEEAVRFLHGMVSNDIKGLAAGQGCYATLLNAQGHMLADLYVFSLGDGLLLETSWDLKDKVQQTLERFIIADAVELHDRSDALTAIALEGPRAREMVSALLEDGELPGENLAHQVRTLEGSTIRVVKRSLSGGDCYELKFAPEAAALVGEKLGALGERFGARPVGLAALNAARVEAGIPWYGVDMVESTLVPEAGIETLAVSYTKGCYVGQEIIERIRSRGHVNRKLTGFFVDGPAKRDDKILDEEKEVGHLTSVVHSPGLNRTIALGYLRVEAIQVGKKLKAAAATLEVAELPFWKP